MHACSIRRVPVWCVMIILRNPSFDCRAKTLARWPLLITEERQARGEKILARYNIVVRPFADEVRPMEVPSKTPSQLILLSSLLPLFNFSSSDQIFEFQKQKIMMLDV